MNANIQFYDGMTTKDIQNVLVRSANDLITLETPNYQYAAARLLLYDVRKEAHGQYEYTPLLKLILRNIRNNVYDKEIVEKYFPDFFDNFFILKIYIFFMDFFLYRSEIFPRFQKSYLENRAVSLNIRKTKSSHFLY